ncbi:hypothetical protein Aca07nite_11500 [Actinoplanes capillaceus]|uniref:Uncharacterized protein n=1 Tax=Actinoplanes campanulatus TaxID=113559 RepID=A0ABQ3WBW8_9ACTN|nr:hypothetical protein Aca07nite_11500 [Actinoplanes capillaceus]
MDTHHGHLDGQRLLGVAHSNAGSVNPGSSTTATVNTATTSGSAQTVALTSSGAPADDTALTVS